MTDPELTKCPQCGAQVRADRLQKHFRHVHNSPNQSKPERISRVSRFKAAGNKSSATQDFGPLTFAAKSDHPIPVEGKTIKGVETVGSAFAFDIFDPNRLTHIELHHITWRNGERDVRIEEINSSLRVFQNRASGGLRLGIYLYKGVFWSELRQARIKDSRDWSGLYKATLDNLDTGANLNTAETLKRLGALAIGARNAVIDDNSGRRNYICVTFPKNNHLVPIAAFVLTRILPLYNGVRI
jgi:hypothetical protein